MVEASLGFVARELTSPQGGFYSSLDADSGGQEGQYYVWDLDELRLLLGEQAEFFETAYGITSAGNWEGRTILQRQVDEAGLAAHFGLTQTQVLEKLADCHARLLAARSKRLRPATDDKVLTAWNGLMLAGLAEAGAAFGDAGLLGLAERNADFLLTGLCPQGSLRHAWRAGQAGREVFLEDYAALILGLLALYQADFNPRWFEQAGRLAAQMLARFSDPQGGFFDTPSDAQTVLVRPKDLQDNATPSGNALAAQALLKLAAFTGREEYRAAARKAASGWSSAWPGNIRPLLGPGCPRPISTWQMSGRWRSSGSFPIRAPRRCLQRCGQPTARTWSWLPRAFLLRQALQPCWSSAPCKPASRPPTSARALSATCRSPSRSNWPGSFDRTYRKNNA